MLSLPNRHLEELFHMPQYDYVLGHSDREVRRLGLQAALLRPGTERILRAAGLGPGQRILDIGTGAGDVARLAAGLVGSSGSVIGLDRETSILEQARARTVDTGLRSVNYEEGTLDTLPAARTFDVVMCRYVVCHQPDHVAFLRQAAARVRPGGTLIVMEPGSPDLVRPDMIANEVWSCPRVALFEEVRDLMLAGLEWGGACPQIGRGLVRLFRAAGLPEPTILLDVPTGGPASPIAELLCLTLEVLVPVLERHGITTAGRLGIETLPARVQDAVVEASSQVRLYELAGAWATLT